MRNKCSQKHELPPNPNLTLVLLCFPIWLRPSVGPKIKRKRPKTQGGARNRPINMIDFCGKAPIIPSCVLLCLLFSNLYFFSPRDLKIENFLLDEHNNIKIVGMLTSECWNIILCSRYPAHLYKNERLSFTQTLAWATPWRLNLCPWSSSTPSVEVLPTRPRSCSLTGSTGPKWTSGLCKS